MKYSNLEKLILIAYCEMKKTIVPKKRMICNRNPVAGANQGFLYYLENILPLLILTRLRKSGVLGKIMAAVFCGFFLVTLSDNYCFADTADDYNKYLYYGRVFFHQGKYREAVNEYKKAEKIHPGSKDAILNQALLYKNMRLYRDSIAEYERLLKIKPDSVIYKNLGEIYLLAGEPLDALNAFNTALKLGKKDALVYFWQGECFVEQKKMEGAIEAYKKAIKLDDKFILPHLRLAEIYLENKMWQDAEKEFEKIKELDPSIKSTYSSLMEIYFNEQNYEQALAIARKVKAIDPGNSAAPQYIAKIHEKTGEAFKEELAKREKIRLEDSFARKVKSVKKLQAPLVRVHIADAKKMRFKCGASFFVQDESTKKIIFSGKKNKLYTIIAGKEEISFFDDKERIADFKTDFSISHDQPNATILIFDVEAGTGEYWASKTDRIYRGKLQIRYGADEYLRIINIVDLEEYLRGVLPSEMPSDWPIEALKAQAIAARSEAYRKLNRHKEQGYDFCSGVHCQVYSGARVETKNSNSAIDQTAGLIAVYNGEAIDAVYSNSCGGHTQGNIFGERVQVDYLKEKQDTLNSTGFYFPLSPLELEDWLWSNNIPVFCNNERFSRRSNFRWQRVYTKKQLEELIRKEIDIGDLIAIDIVERHPSSHIHRIKITASKGEFFVEKELNIRNLLGNLRSGMFNIDIKLDKKNIVKEFLFYGGGWGHGVGMCQVGAATMAEHGFNCDEILKFYYSGINMKKIY